MDIYELFEELKYNQPTVKISNLKAIYNSSLKDYPSEGSKSEKKEKADDKTMEV